EPRPDYYAVIGVADKAKVSGLLSRFAENGMLTKNDNYYALQNELFIIEKGNAIILTGTESMKQFALEGNGEKLNAELTGMLTGNACSLYFNISNIPSDFYTTAGALVKDNIEESKVESVSATGSTMTNNTSTAKIVITFKDKR